VVIVRIGETEELMIGHDDFTAKVSSTNCWTLWNVIYGNFLGGGKIALKLNVCHFYWTDFDDYLSSMLTEHVLNFINLADRLD